jgi:small subunit ribosomal protein S8e
LSKKIAKKKALRAKEKEVEPALLEQFSTGRLLACVSSRPGQVGRADGYILEGPELAFYNRQIYRRRK